MAFVADGSILPRESGVSPALVFSSRGEYQSGHIEGFLNVPVDELRERLDELEKSKPVYVMCQSGLRSYIACRILEGNGFQAYNFSGGFRFYEAVTRDKALAETASACGMEKQP